MFNFARTQFSFVWTLEKSDSSNVAFCMFYLTRKIILIGGDDDDEDDQDGEGGDEGGGESRLYSAEISTLKRTPILCCALWSQNSACKSPSFLHYFFVRFRSLKSFLNFMLSDFLSSFLQNLQNAFRSFFVER